MLQDLTEEHLEELAKDPKNVVYHWKDQHARLSPDDVVSIDVVRDRVKRLFELYSELRKTMLSRRDHIGEREWKNIHHRILQDAEWKRFSETHPLIFDRVVHPETTEKEVKAVLFMIFLKEQERLGKCDNPQEVLSEYIVGKFAISQEEWDRQSAEARGAGDSVLPTVAGNLPA